mgnify:CR=1 FL=1
MNRRNFLLGGLAGLLAARLANAATTAASTAAGTVKGFIQAPAFWRKKVSDEAWDVLFREDTESRFSSQLNYEKHAGTFVCAACYLPLFESQNKFESGTGWPSFTQPIDGHVGLKEDNRLFTTRTEYHCARCEGHQGHVFDDGPKPTGLRYCNNGLAIRFVPKGEKLPALRT